MLTTLGVPYGKNSIIGAKTPLAQARRASAGSIPRAIIVAHRNVTFLKRSRFKARSGGVSPGKCCFGHMATIGIDQLNITALR